MGFRGREDKNICFCILFYIDKCDHRISINASVAPAFVGHTVLGVGVIVVLLADLSEAFIAGGELSNE